MILIAHNIRSMYNVGSIFRNAAAFGVEKLYLTGITAQPPRKEIAKVALGAETLQSWEGGEITEIIQDYRARGYKIYALDNTEGAINIQEAERGDVVLILGNEVEGVDAEVLAEVDKSLFIPMQAKKSLNVSVATGIALYEFLV